MREAVRHESVYHFKSTRHSTTAVRGGVLLCEVCTSRKQTKRFPDVSDPHGFPKVDNSVERDTRHERGNNATLIVHPYNFQNLPFKLQDITTPSTVGQTSNNKSR